MSVASNTLDSLLWGIYELQTSLIAFGIALLGAYNLISFEAATLFILALIAQILDRMSGGISE